MDDVFYLFLQKQQIALRHIPFEYPPPGIRGFTYLIIQNDDKNDDDDDDANTVAKLTTLQQHAQVARSLLPIY